MWCVCVCICNWSRQQKDKVNVLNVYTVHHSTETNLLRDLLHTHAIFNERSFFFRHLANPKIRLEFRSQGKIILDIFVFTNHFDLHLVLGVFHRFSMWQVNDFSSSTVDTMRILCWKTRSKVNAAIEICFHVANVFFSLLRRHLAIRTKVHL